MNYTREPIIETIITPKDGFKLVLKNSKGGSQEEYTVDAVEVVSFGQSMFFRSLEKPKSFLLPVGDYEIVEAKETRVVLKNAPLERPIKIGGGRVQKANKDKDSEEEKPRRRKSSRRRKPSDVEQKAKEEPKGAEESKTTEETKKTELIPPPSEGVKVNKPEQEGGDKKDEAKVSSSMFKSLFPPPPGLISENIQREEDGEKAEGNLFSEDVMPKPSETKEEDTPEVKEDDEPKTQDKTPSFPSFEKDKKKKKEDNDDSDDEGDSPRYHEAPRDEKDDSSEGETMQKVTEEIVVPSLNPETNLV
ncbi:MAG: hypothetical protein S4CHLAM37_04850 [Chlamydiia bacterium]|nr:hypothetical protein [Chlamydiia bacterium]